MRAALMAASSCRSQVHKSLSCAGLRLTLLALSVDLPGGRLCAAPMIVAQLVTHSRHPATLLPAPPYALRPAQTPPGEVCCSDAVGYPGFEQIFAAFSRSGRHVRVRDVELRAPMSAGAPGRIHATPNIPKAATIQPMSRKVLTRPRPRDPKQPFSMASSSPEKASPARREAD
jgi:hypothetical protein